jgi:hypothetical protein
MVPDMVPDAVLEEFAEALVPEAFERPTRAVRVRLEEHGPGADAFDAWAVDRLAEALTATWPSGGHPSTVGALSDGRLCWWYDDGGCGFMEGVTGAMGHEVWDIDEPWLFGAVLARPEGRWEVLYDEDGSEVDEVWREPTRTDWRAAWYAEGRGRGAATRQAGLLRLDAEVIVEHRPLEVRDTRATNELHRVLYRHPARKRHPLRRRRRAR